MTAPSQKACTAESGFSTVELAIGVFLLFALLLGVLVLVTMEGRSTDEEFVVSPYRSMYATYIHNRMAEWSMQMQVFEEKHSSPPGDSPEPRLLDERGRPVGNSNGRVERETGENRKAFHDLYVTGLASEPAIRVRGRVMDFYWRGQNENGTRSLAGNYLALPNVNHDEALALDHKYDDKDPASGDVLFFPDPDGTVELFVRYQGY